MLTEAGGVSGPVTFHVKSDTYTEKVAIAAVTGASDANTITFQSEAIHADSVGVNPTCFGGRFGCCKIKQHQLYQL